MAKQEYLNFKEISEKISFEDVLNWLNIPFEKTEKELRGEEFIINIEKNLFFNPKDENDKGSVINFVANRNKIGVREAASLLKSEFLSTEEVKPKRELPNLELHYHEYLKEYGISQEIAEEYEVGFVKQRSVMSGRIALKVYDHKSENLGYIGYKVDKDNWFFPRGFKRPLYNSFKVINKDFVIVTVNPFDALRIISLGEKRVVSLLAKSMTNDQQEELRKFNQILLVHRNPENIVQRLSKYAFIKAIVFTKEIKELSDEELKNITCPET
ncbi:MAG: hypothetical protein K1X86_14915 [Ignavibacteria bacterium]|nr:hypothetical protein [Ignavibacteria bacterium]